MTSTDKNRLLNLIRAGERQELLDFIISAPADVKICPRCSKPFPFSKYVYCQPCRVLIQREFRERLRRL